jgi:hypothetical protein
MRARDPHPPIVNHAGTVSPVFTLPTDLTGHRRICQTGPHGGMSGRLAAWRLGHHSATVAPPHNRKFTSHLLDTGMDLLHSSLTTGE